MRSPPDLFELRLDRLDGMADQLENVLPKLHTPLIITARHPRTKAAAADCHCGNGVRCSVGF